MPRLEPFCDELPIPDTIHPLTRNGEARIAIRAQPTSVRLHAALPLTPCWSYRLADGDVARAGRGTTYLGPTVVVTRGQELTVTWSNAITKNGLPFEVVRVPNADSATTIPVPQNVPGCEGALAEEQDSTRRQVRTLQPSLVTHLHGGRTQAYSDGWPEDLIVRGQSAKYTYANDQSAAMLWYHDHAMHVTRLSVYAGLAGAWIVRAGEEARIALPEGAFELPLVIQDRNLDVNQANEFTGALLHKTELGDGPMEFFGPFTLVNGVIWPKRTVEPRLYRFRLLNASNARTYRLHLLTENGRVVNECATLIGCDRGLMERPTEFPDEGLVLAPAERVDLLVDFSDYSAQRLYLWNTAEAPFGNDSAQVPSLENMQREIAALVHDPFASAASIDKRNDTNRRPFPQVMRFDVAVKASSASNKRPSNVLTESPVAPRIDADSPVRMVTLVEEPAPASSMETSTLVFWEFMPVEEQPAPPSANIVSFTYWHPGRNVFETKDYWKGAAYFYDPINWKVLLETTELWYVVNLSADTHPFHVHLVDLLVHQRWTFAWNGEGLFDPSAMTLKHIKATQALPIPPEVIGPKDTVRVNPGEMVGIAITFAPYAGRYLYHCHILEHEDHDMMRPFVITAASHVDHTGM